MATAPTIPTVITPSDNTKLFVDNTLTCGGSTGADNISIEFWRNETLGDLQTYTTDSGWTAGGASANLYSLSKINTTGCGDCYIENVTTGTADTGSILAVYGSDGSTQLFNVSISSNVAVVQKNLSPYNIYYFGVTNTGGWTAVRKDVGGGTPTTNTLTTYVGGANNVGEPFGAGILDDRFQSIYEINMNPNTTTFSNFIGNATEGNTAVNWTTITNGAVNSWTCRACNNNSECSNSTGLRNINRMNFTQCTSGNMAFNVSFLNESDLSTMNGAVNSLSLTFDSDDSGDYIYTYTNLTERSNLTFCLDPSGNDLSTTGTISYSASGFPQRTTSITETLNGDTLINKVVYLLPTADGIYTTFQVIDAGNSPISGVTVIAEKQLSGTYTVIGGGTTDASGAFTLWVDPNSVHRFTFSKTGYTTSTETITPTQTSYTVTLGGATVTNETNYNIGILYNTLPRDSTLNFDTDYNFAFNISSSYWNLSSYGFVLRNSTTVLVDKSAGTSTGSFVNQTYNTTANSNLYMDYYWIVDGNSQNGTINWYIRNVTQGDFSMMNFFDDLKNFNQEGFDGFSLALVFIFILVIIVGLIYSYATDIIQMEYAVLGSIVLLVWLGEYTEMLQPIGQQYFITIIAGLIFLAYAIQDNVR